MIVTNDFVMLNFPKTGSSFAREIIAKAYHERRSWPTKLIELAGFARPSLIELMLPHPYLDAKDQHGRYSQIPSEYLNRKILSIVRNPVGRYLSLYNYRWWQKYPPLTAEEIRNIYPGFPELSFKEFYWMTQEYSVKQRLKDVKPKIALGLNSLMFIEFYFKDPKAVIKKIDDDYIDSGKYKNDMADIYFIHQESLKSELKHFLISACGFKESRLGFIDIADPVNVSKKSEKHDAIDKNIIEDIMLKDKLIFKIFPEYAAAP